MIATIYDFMVDESYCIQIDAKQLAVIAYLQENDIIDGNMKINVIDEIVDLTDVKIISDLTKEKE